MVTVAPRTPGLPIGDLTNPDFAGVLDRTADQGLHYWLGPSGDTTGVHDRTMVKKMLDLKGRVHLTPGTFWFDNITPQSFGGIIGSGMDQTIINMVGNPFMVAPAVLTDTFEIAHCTINAPSAVAQHIFSGVWAVRWHVHDCKLIQNNSGKGIWNATTSGGQVMLECRFERNIEQVFGAIRTVEAWFLSSASGSTQINENRWRNNILFNENMDQTQYWYHIQSTGSNNAGNSFEDLTFEHPFGGMIWLESHTRGLISQCLGYDLLSSAGTISNHLVQISKNAGGLASSRNLILNGVRNQQGSAFAAGVGDIGLDSACQQTTIINPAASGDLAIYLGGSTGARVINPGLPAGWLADSATTAVAGAQAGSGPPAPVVSAGPTNESGTVTWGTGTGSAQGAMANVTFGTPFTIAPTVILMPYNKATALLEVFTISPSASGFQIAVANAPADGQGNTVYGVRYYAAV